MAQFATCPTCGNTDITTWVGGCIHCGAAFDGEDVASLTEAQQPISAPAEDLYVCSACSHVGPLGDGYCSECGDGLQTKWPSS